jgi:superfamily II DNA or RNA helicase
MSFAYDARGFLALQPSDAVRATITQELTITPKTLQGTAAKPFEIFQRTEGGGCWAVPPHWGRRHLGDRPFADPVPAAEMGVFKGTLDPARHQHDDAARLLEVLRTRGGALHCVPCGFGKTTLALFVIAQLRVKTLVCVHKTFLLEQWRERCAQHLPAARLGFFTGGKETGCAEADIVLATVQTLARHAPSVRFGLLVVDECHLVCTRVFTRALFRVPTPLTLGLSATPERRDGCFGVIETFLGEVATHRQRPFDPGAVSVRIIETDTSRLRSRKMRGPDGREDLVYLISQIVADRARTTEIARAIADARAENHNILVLSERRQHLVDIAAALHEQLPGMLDEEIGFYVGGTKQDKLDEAGSRAIVLGTYTMASTGLDLPHLDCLVLATPRTSIVQAIGRVQRTPGMRALLFDFADRLPGILENQFRARKRVYKNNGWTIDVSQ